MALNKAALWRVLPAAPAALAGGPGASTDVLTKARLWASRQEAAVQGCDGSGACFAVAKGLAEFGLSVPDVIMVLEHAYNVKCAPPWTAQELKHKAEDAVRRYQASRSGMSDQRRTRSEAKRLAEVPTEAEVDARIATQDPHPVYAHYEEDDYSEEPLEYLCPSLGFAAGKVNNVEAPWGGAKTPCALSYGIHAAAGRPWCGHAFPRPLQTLYLAHEGAGVARRKRARMCRALGIDDPKSIPFWIWRGKGAFDENSLTALEAFCKERKIDQIIVDTLTSANRASEVSQTDERYAKVLWMLGGMSEALALAVIVLAHLGKDASRGAAGTYAIDGAAQCIWKLSAGAEPGTFVWTCARAPEEPLPEFAVRIADVPAEDGTDAKWGLVVERADGAPARAEKPGRQNRADNERKAREGADARQQGARLMLAQLRIASGQRRDALRDASGLGRTAAYALLAEMVAAGVLRDVGGMIPLNPGAPSVSMAMFTGTH